VAEAARHLLVRATTNAHKLNSPDAWFHTPTRTLTFRDPGATVGGFIALRPGDSLHSSHVMHVSFLHHDMVYVGLGYVVGFNRIDNWLAGEVALNRLDVFPFQPEARFTANHFPRYMPRLQVVQRALATLGYYTYDPVRFNCQHVYHVILGNQPHSLGAEKLLTLTFFCMAVLVVLIVAVAVMVHRHKLRRGRTRART
jgi:hypothetical protein